MKNPVFVALVEVQPKFGCELDPSQVAGAMVRCYVLAPDVNTAQDRIATELKRDYFDLIEIEWCVDESVTEWENPDDEEAGKNIQKARNTNSMIFSEFHTWGHEA